MTLTQLAERAMVPRERFAHLAPIRGGRQWTRPEQMSRLTVPG